MGGCRPVSHRLTDSLKRVPSTRLTTIVAAGVSARWREQKLPNSFRAPYAHADGGRTP